MDFLFWVITPKYDTNFISPNLIIFSFSLNNLAVVSVHNKCNVVFLEKEKVLLGRPQNATGTWSLVKLDDSHF